MKVETKSKKKLNPRVDPQTDMLIDLVHEMIGEEDDLDLCLFLGLNYFSLPI